MWFIRAMTATIAGVLAQWRNHDDVGEDPPGSNSTIFGKWYGMNPAPWCSMALSFNLVSAGFEFPDDAQGKRKGFASVEMFKQWAKRHDCWVPWGATPEPGWIVVYDWQGDGHSDHIGQVDHLEGPVAIVWEGNAPDRQRGETDDEISLHRLGPGGDRTHCQGYIVLPLDATGAPMPVAAAAAPAQPTGRPQLAEGSSGALVKVVQSAVGAKADGIFGPKTTKAVKVWQKAHGLAADGVVGPKTWATIDSTPAAPPTPAPQAARTKGFPGRNMGLSSPFMRGDDIKFVQRALGIADDGIFGPQSDKAVRAFQSSHGLAVDGLVGPATWGALHIPA